MKSPDWLCRANGPLLVDVGLPSTTGYLEQYWAASKGLAESWNRSAKSYTTLSGDSTPEDFDKWVQIRGALDEIFISEMLTRVWTAVLVACDRHSGNHAAEPIARNVLAAHLEARQRALGLLLDGRGFSTRAGCGTQPCRCADAGPMC